MNILRIYTKTWGLNKMSPLFHGMSGSTGVAAAIRVSLVIDRWLTGPATSAAWTNLWDNRTALFREDTLDQSYQIGGGETNTPLGYFAFYRRLVGSTRNTSSGGKFGILGLPEAVWDDFSTRVDTAIAAESTANDNGIGDIVYNILVSTLVNYQDGTGKGLLSAWAATTLTQESTANTLRDSS